MKRIAAMVWRALRGSVQWRLLWIWHATFMVGVTGIVRDDDDRILLLRHRLWPKDRQWGLPTGYAKKSESFEATIVREVLEETGLKVRVRELANLKSGYRLRVEVAYEADFVGGSVKLASFEILEAQWFSRSHLPEGLLESHRLLIQRDR
ncbi:NUDIX domain-containing protein [Frankia sp. AiPs1]|uniref:NUDIX domain-containing protein n=1 Tax=Frankia sp. AiPs1 TaxID=573493 RepID=UPI00204352A4|nr:NUDIX domain-containing protein [Frankia sp. AiPs1]MCM3922237.1 NUDIX domain-containing protein [Frankia sp. AiPs1]